MTRAILAFELDIHWQMTHEEYANDVIHLHKIE
jgi:hypothetical protein